MLYRNWKQQLRVSTTTKDQIQKIEYQMGRSWWEEDMNDCRHKWKTLKRVPVVHQCDTNSSILERQNEWRRKLDHTTLYVTNSCTFDVRNLESLMCTLDEYLISVYLYKARCSHLQEVPYTIISFVSTTPHVASQIWIAKTVTTHIWITYKENTSEELEI